LRAVRHGLILHPDTAAQPRAAPDGRRAVAERPPLKRGTSGGTRTIIATDRP
jgi:hypothetical protein